jgi:hypothetical protein
MSSAWNWTVDSLIMNLLNTSFGTWPECIPANHGACLVTSGVSSLLLNPLRGSIPLRPKTNYEVSAAADAILNKETQ